MFKKGYIQTKEQREKINTPERAKKISNTLKLLYKTGKRVCWTKGKKLTSEHKLNIKKSCKFGSDNKSWTGEYPNYSTAHLWINKYFGKAIKCENRKNNILKFRCSKKSNNFQWAKKKGHRYSRNIEDYFQLCVSCHSKYDFNRKNKECSIVGCNKKYKGLGYCDKHYQRFKKWGNPLAKKSHNNPIKYII